MQQLSCEIVSQPSQSQPSQNVIPLRLTTSREKAVAGIDELFGVDLRALAVFRIAMGLVTAADLIIRSRHLFTHYTDQGILPRVALIEKFMPLTDFSFHLFMGTVGGQAFLFLIAGILSLLLIVGYKTRLVTFLSWVFLISLQNRNPMVNHSGDVMLRLLYFWSLFLPLGAKFSIDAALNRSEGQKPTRYFSMATIAIILQVCFIYLFAAILKSGKEWHGESSALFYTLYIDQLVTPFGVWFRQFKEILPFITSFVWYLEILGPLLFFSPYAFTFLRTAAILSFIGLHLGIVLCLGLGVFPWISITSLLVLMPTGVWDKLALHLNNGTVKRIGNITYQWITTYRTMLGNWAHQYLPYHNDSLRPSLLGNLVVTFFLVSMFLWNLTTIPGSGISVPKFAREICRIVSIDQMWNMFAPRPLSKDGWYVIPGQLENGKSVDVMNFREQAVVWAKPRLISELFLTERDQKYMMNIWIAVNAQYRLYYGQYLCRMWNAERQAPNRLKDFEIFFMREDTLANKELPAQKVSIWKHQCF